MGGQRIDLLTNSAAATGAAFRFRGGKVFYYAEAGTWSTSTVKLQFQSPQSTWIDVTDASFSANGGMVLELPEGQYRAVAAGGSLAGAYAAMTTIPTQIIR